MLAAIDLDDTVFDFQRAWERTAFQVLGHARCVRALAPSRRERYRLDARERAAVWAAFDWRYRDSLPGAISAVRRLMQGGWTVFAVTAVPEQLRAEREAALAASGIAMPVHCVGWRADKGSHLLHADLFVDDDPHHCERALELGVADVFWVGRTYPVQHECRARRVDTLEEAVSWLFSDDARLTAHAPAAASAEC